MLVGFRDVLGEGFTWIGQVDSVRGLSADGLVNAVKSMGDISAVIVSEPRSILGVANTVVVSGIIKRETGLEVICQLTCRDRNRVALLSDVLAAGML